MKRVKQHEHDPGECCTAGQPGVKCPVANSSPHGMSLPTPGNPAVTPPAQEKQEATSIAIDDRYGDFTKGERFCDGCGGGGSIDASHKWASIFVLVSDERGQRFTLIGYYCERCRDREWAYRGHLVPADPLFTEHELCVALGLEGLRPGETDGPLIASLRRLVALPEKSTSAPAQGKLGPPTPVLLPLWCPFCRAPHIDDGKWATRPHHVHLCAQCGREWDALLYSYGAVPAASSAGPDLLGLIQEARGFVHAYVRGKAWVPGTARPLLDKIDAALDRAAAGEKGECES